MVLKRICGDFPLKDVNLNEIYRNNVTGGFLTALTSCGELVLGLRRKHEAV
jgi:hypothetical protein